MEQPQEEEVVTGSASPAPTDHKRKHEDLEPESLETQRVTADTNGKSESHSAERGEEEDDLEAKRQRLEDKSDVSAAENGQQETSNYLEEVGLQPHVQSTDGTPAAENGQQVTSNYPEEVGVQPPVESTDGTEDPKQSAGADEQVNDEELIAQHDQPEATERTSDDNIRQEIAKTEASDVDSLKHPEELQGHLVDKYQQEVTPSTENQDTYEAKMSRKMDVPNNKVGVLIGKAGDTIRYLQLNSGARIQITRDADADPYAGSRPVELIGTLESINKAEKLIKDVIAEADAGGSPSLVARGFNTVQAAGAGEQIQIQVPNEKVGVIIGKGGETIKSLQTRSGARIQLIPQHLPEGDQSKERTVRVTGDKKQIEMAREMIKEVMDQNARPSTASSSYNQQHPRDPATHWGSRGSHAAQQGGYDYQQRGPYQPHNQYPPQAYGNYPPQQMGPRSNFGWDRRPHGPNGGYDYYGGPGGHASDASKPIHTPAPGPSQPNYNYGQSPYSHMAPHGQSYGQGYNENNQAAVQHLYGGHRAPQQPSSYPQATAHPGYAQQDQYGRPPYGMPQQGPHVQSYGQPRGTEPGNMPYQGPISSTNPYAQAASTQQPYPYATGGQMQQAYPPYSSAPPADGYNQPLPTVAGPGYPQQGAQPVSGYGQPAGQSTPGYAQGGPTGGYAQYPTSQPGYAEQAAPNAAAAYGAYQGSENPAYSGAASYGAQPVAQPIYSQPPPNQQQVYDQSVAQSGGYATAPATYVKGASPQPAAFQQYDASQMYGAQR